MREAGQSRGQTQGTMRYQGNLPDPSGSPGVRAAPQRLLTEKGLGFHTPAPVCDGLLVFQACLLEETALGCQLASGEGHWEMGTPAQK